MNYYPQRDGQIAEIDANQAASSELVQRHLAGSLVVKAFNNLSFLSLSTLAEPAGEARSALPIAGNDARAKAEVTALLDVLGYDTVDVGDLAESWRFEPGTPVYVQPYFPGPVPEGIDQDGFYKWVTQTPTEPVSAGRVEQLTGAAVRSGR